MRGSIGHIEEQDIHLQELGWFMGTLRYTQEGAHALFLGPG